MYKMKIVELDAGTKEQPLLELLREAGFFLGAPCGGQGRCQKCRIQFFDGAPEPTKNDRAACSEEEIREGWRLACQSVGRGKLRLGIPSFLLEKESKKEETPMEENVSAEEKHAMVAIDVGTTTLAAAEIDPVTGAKKKTGNAMNSQRSFGADVISRIHAACRGRKDELQQMLWEDIMDMIAQMGLSWEQTELVLSGNTTMGHLLQGYSCETLGKAPYQPVDLSCHFFSWKGNERILFLPGISTFVGADIVSGIAAAGMHEREEITLLVDVGTNGEIALGNREKLLVTSAAAGPAFEGGNISCGMAAIPGAINRVWMEREKIEVDTIGQQPPIGICGTGVLELVGALLRHGWIGTDGRLQKTDSRSGVLLHKGKNGKNVMFTQKDIREVQYAKSAIRTGIEILLKEYGISHQAVKRVFLAGSFGKAMRVESAVEIGLLPEIWQDRTKVAGNTSLEGAAKLIAGEIFQEDYKKIQAMAKEIPLAEHPDFQENYLKNMWFPQNRGGQDDRDSDF